MRHLFCYMSDIQAYFSKRIIACIKKANNIEAYNVLLRGNMMGHYVWNCEMQTKDTEMPEASDRQWS